VRCSDTWAGEDEHAVVFKTTCARAYFIICSRILWAGERRAVVFRCGRGWARATCGWVMVLEY
jgi:hypothetical protein